MYEYACAHILRVTFSVFLGWFQTDARTEPGSWLVVGMIPVFDWKKAVRAGRPEDGPKSAASRLICVTHQVCADRDYLSSITVQQKPNSGGEALLRLETSSWLPAAHCSTSTPGP